MADSSVTIDFAQLARGNGWTDSTRGHSLGIATGSDTQYLLLTAKSKVNMKNAQLTGGNGWAGSTGGNSLGIGARNGKWS